MMVSESARETGRTGRGGGRGFDPYDPPEFKKIMECVHCGLCLPTCPTYIGTGREADSPRGRIYLIRAVAEGRASMTDLFTEHMNFCLDCRACETVCPSGVSFGKIMEATRGQMGRLNRKPLKKRLLEEIIFRKIFPHPRRLEVLADALHLYQVSGARGLVRGSGLLNLLPGGLAEKERMLPPIAGKGERRKVPEVVPARGERRRRVAFFSGCVMRILFSDVNRDTVEVLSRNGCEVITPKDQICCGALHAHTGVREVAREMARRNIDVFGDLDVEAIIINAAGCGSNLKEYPFLLKDDPKYGGKAEEFASKVKDVSEYLVGLPLNGDMGRVPLKVVYDEPCHLIHAQRITREPKKILSSIPGIEIVPLPEADMCCGSAGIYNITHTSYSMYLLDRKMSNIAGTRAEAIVTANPGCQIQLRLGAERRGMRMPVLHFVQLLNESYRRGEKEAGA